MPTLTDPRREAFARAVVRCGNLTVAYRQAGYIGGRGDASKMAARPPVAARIEEIARQREKIEGAGLEATIADLMAMAGAADALNSAAACKEARIARLEAHRLWSLWASREDNNRRPLERELTVAEWEARFGHLARGGGAGGALG